MQRVATLVAVGLMTFSCGGGDPTGTGGGGGFGGGSGVGGGTGTGGGATASCGPSNCAGCCFNGACQPGNTGAACGKLGSACLSCSASQVCRADQLCGVDPESTWKVQPTAAVIAPNNNGSAWDGDNSAPDPRVFMTCADSMTPTSTIEVTDSYQPRWTTGGCTAKAKDLLRAGWTMQVYDIDLVTDDTITGNLRFTLTEQEFNNGGFSAQPTGGLQSMTVTLTKQ